MDEDKREFEQLLRGSLDQNAQNIVVKVGTRVLTNQGRVDLEQIHSLASQLAALANQGRRVSLVSSGAVGTAMSLLDTDRPRELGRLQAYAAIGQAELIHHYNRAFEKHGRKAAQVLLTIEDMNHRRRYLNLRNSIFSLFELSAIPIINENDCVATEEIAVTFGDNDRLAANVALLVDADLLVILSDVDAVFDRNPDAPEARPVPFISDIDSALAGFVQTSSSNSRAYSKGGMQSKLQAARIASSVGIPVVIAGGRRAGVLQSVLSGEQTGTLIAGSGGESPRKTTTSKKRWIRSATAVHGSLTVDEGAKRAIVEQGRSLLPIGVTALAGEYEAGDFVKVVDSNGIRIGQGITNFSSYESSQILGCRSDELFEKLGRVVNEELIHRDNLVLE